ncbi:hypothetical protein BU24DRAFT_416623 [Aaosphaeria arxii CBS 175.79]|uniref:Uncharacterized protein n=1 Tax=Aaosphaeria arxii CBS 175.79 TaxID=1450172 RepID=A0A6A5Y5X3_9PLEO|nr:uncharacterized protein BU24DRAFT_416623 [Aaosphaeria arxii CBS 175.79]KAF2020955.1 hypothetical protein BU24DRAFT_416623 [Aaosphaeria arxii CBS 175.79]
MSIDPSTHPSSHPFTHYISRYVRPSIHPFPKPKSSSCVFCRRRRRRRVLRSSPRYGCWTAAFASFLPVPAPPTQHRDTYVPNVPFPLYFNVFLP